MKCESTFSDLLQIHKCPINTDLPFMGLFPGLFTVKNENKMKFINWLLLPAMLLISIPGKDAMATASYSAIENTAAAAHSSDAETPVLPPVAICRNITVSLGPAGTATITGLQVDGGSYDPDGTITVRSVTPDTFSCTDLGSNSVTLTVTDNEGLTASCNATVIVADRTSPSALCRNATLYLDVTGKAKLGITDINNGSSDNCPAGFFLYLSRTDFSCSDIGSPVAVTLTATDGSGNSAACTARVTVLDTVKPRVLVKPFNLVLGSSGTGLLLPGDVDNGTFDNCGPVTLSVSPETFSCSDIGPRSVTLNALDTHGNSASQKVTITVSSDLNIKATSLSSCGMTPTLALFESNVEGGNGVYSYFWKGLDETKKPFMEITTWPPSVHFYNTSALATPYFNNNLPNAAYDIRLVVTDGNGCRDTSDIKIDKTGPVFNNRTMRKSEACEGEVAAYSVNYSSGATYSWSVVNGTILNSDQDTSRINIRWNPGETEGIVTTTINNTNPVFPGGDCQSAVIDTVALFPVPLPAFDNPVLNACSGTGYLYTLTGSYNYYLWTVTGGVITGGGSGTDNHVSVLWGSGSAGTITVSAGNVSLCSGSAAITVSIDNLAGNLASVTNVTCNGYADGMATAGAVSGTGIAPYEYSVDGGAFSSSGSFNALSPGNHSISLRDALLCTVELPFIITQPSPVYATVSAVEDVSCFGGSDGSATIIGSGGYPPFSYRLNSGSFQGSNIFNNLAAGSYTVTIADNKGCLGSVSFNITQPLTPLNGNVVTTNINCFGESTGAISLSVTGGVPPFAYLWNNGSTTADISNLPAGSYTVAITDSRGCVVNVNAVLTQPDAPLTGTATILNSACYGESTGSIDLLVSGGVSPYTYLWSNGSAAATVSNLPAGSYSVTVTDSKGCTVLYTYSVAQPPSAVTGSVTSQVNVSCRGEADGNVTALGAGGTPPYEYAINGGAYGSSGTFTGLSAGNHIVLIRDHNLCTYNLPVTITEPAAPLSGTVVSFLDVACFGNSTGNMTIAGNGGTPPYTYSLDGGAYQPAGLFGNLPAGVHTVTIRDLNQCQFILPLTISQPASPLTVSASKTDLTCRGVPTGTALAAGAGGTQPYTYSWNTSPVQTGPAAAGLSAGTYTVTVTDANGCTETTSVAVDQPAVSISAVATVTDAACFGSTTGSVDLSVSNGVVPVTYLWSNGSADEDIEDLSAGIYTVSVTDTKGCKTVATATVGQPEKISGTIIVTNAACQGGDSGYANLSVSGGVPPYTYLWSNGATTEDADTLSAGTYTVEITDANGCTASVSCIISQPASTLGGSIISQTNASEYGTNTGSVTVSGTGGSGSYDYRINGGPYQPSGTFNLLYAGIHTVTIRDGGICTFLLTVVITQPSVSLSARIVSQSNVLCYEGETGSVTVTGWGGTAPYAYSIDEVTFSDSGIFTLLGAGRDTIVVRDALDEIYRLPFEIAEPEPLSIALVKTDALCRGGATGTATVTVAGGTGPYIYEWNTNPAQTTAVATGLISGTYMVSVTDINGCNITGEINIYQPYEDLTVTITPSDPRCAGGLNGSATAVISGGTGPYSFSWDTDPVQSEATATGIGAGNYTVSITDFNGCTASGSVTIADPEPVSLEYTTSIASCPDSDDGSVTLDVTGGAPPYNFIWSDNATTQNRTNLKPGPYSVVVTDQNSCAASIDAVVDFTGTFECVEIPQIITPNNDGYNDTWILRNIDLYPDAEMLVFNRWGKLIFRTKNISDNPWDGTYDGKFVPTDSYHYILYLNDGSDPKTGVISVIR